MDYSTAYPENSLVLIGIGGVGSHVLEQLILGDHRFSNFVVADSRHVVPGLSTPDELSSVLKAKRNGGLFS